MRKHDFPSTSLSLIEQAQNDNAKARATLCEVYSPLVESWVRRSGMQDSDVSDIVQNVFQIVLRSLGRFHRDQPGDTFRGWLWTITKNEIRGLLRAQITKNTQARGGTDAHEAMMAIPDWVNDDSNCQEIEPEESAETAVLLRALDVIKSDFEEHTWQAFWRSTVDGHSSADIATDLGMAPNAVRQAKFRVMARLKKLLS